MYTGHVFIFRNPPYRSSPLASKKEAKRWCYDNHNYDDDVWVVTDSSGVVVDMGICDKMYENDPKEILAALLSNDPT